MNKRLWIYEGKRTLGGVIGAFIYASGINLFVVPSGFYTGGIMGISQIIRTLLADYLHFAPGNIDFAGIIYYLINIPIFVLAFTRIGRKFFFKTLIAVTSMTVFLSVLPTAPLVEDAMAACVVGGIMAGAGVGLMLRMGASGGGMDAVGVLLIRWKKDFSVGKVNLFMNLALYAACLFLFDVQIVIYSVIYAAVSAVALDKVHIQNINVEATVVTKTNTVALEKDVFEELGRGITKWTSLGAYTHEQSHILYILLSKYEVGRLKTIVHKHDPDAFIVVNEGVSVIGHFLKKL